MRECGRKYGRGSGSSSTSSSVFSTGSSLHIHKEATGGGCMVPHAAVVATGWEYGDVLGLFQCWVNEELVVPNVLAD